MKIKQASGIVIFLLKKKQMLEKIYKMLTIHLGNPPKNFDWQTRDKKKKFLRIENLNPNSFYNDHIGLKLMSMCV